jgi:hypothetical protein
MQAEDFTSEILMCVRSIEDPNLKLKFAFVIAELCAAAILILPNPEDFFQGRTSKLHLLRTMKRIIGRRMTRQDISYLRRSYAELEFIGNNIDGVRDLNFFGTKKFHERVSRVGSYEIRRVYMPRHPATQLDRRA